MFSAMVGRFNSYCPVMKQVCGLPWGEKRKAEKKREFASYKPDLIFIETGNSLA